MDTGETGLLLLLLVLLLLLSLLPLLLLLVLLLLLPPPPPLLPLLLLREQRERKRQPAAPSVGPCVLCQCVLRMRIVLVVSCERLAAVSGYFQQSWIVFGAFRNIFTINRIAIFRVRIQIHFYVKHELSIALALRKQPLPGDCSNSNCPPAITNVKLQHLATNQPQLELTSTGLSEKESPQRWPRLSACSAP